MSFPLSNQTCSKMMVPSDNKFIKWWNRTIKLFEALQMNDLEMSFGARNQNRSSLQNIKLFCKFARILTTGWQISHKLDLSFDNSSCFVKVWSNLWCLLKSPNHCQSSLNAYCHGQHANSQFSICSFCLNGCFHEFVKN